MNFKKVAVLTSENNWFIPYAQKLVVMLANQDYKTKLFFDHKNIDSTYEIVFILSYFKIIPQEHLAKHKHNIVVHSSDLPLGRGWSPMFWQILENKNSIPTVLFEAVPGVDEGKIYLKDYIQLAGCELNEEMRQKQAQKIIDLCLCFLDKYATLKPYHQQGVPSYYRKRTPTDSLLDINKTIAEQFNLMRIAHNEDFPLFFYNKGKKYILKITQIDD